MRAPLGKRIHASVSERRAGSGGLVAPGFGDAGVGGGWMGRGRVWKEGGRETEEAGT